MAVSQSSSAQSSLVQAAFMQSSFAYVDNELAQPSGRCLLLLGPNLNRSEERDTKLYGGWSMQEQIDTAKTAAHPHSLALDAVQSASEAELVQVIHEARRTHHAIVINAGAFTHYAWGLRDALDLFRVHGPIIEVHLSFLYARESWRHTSVISPVATGMISGLGVIGYAFAIEAAAQILSIRTQKDE